ncbi:MAG: hypothetical protein ABJN26_25220 [Stappiaceae bacterium]
MAKFILNLFLSVALIFGPLVSPAMARKGDYKLILAGVEVMKQGKKIALQKNDDIFIMTMVEHQNGKTAQPRKFPDGDGAWKNFKKGDIYSLDEEVWKGRGQNIVLYAQVRKMNKVKKNLVKGLFIGSGILGAIGITIVTKGAAGKVGAVMVERSGDFVARKVEEEASKFSLNLGQASQEVQLKRAAGLANKPDVTRRGLKYHFKTTHKGNKGHYRLFWVIERE